MRIIILLLVLLVYPTALPAQDTARVNSHTDENLVLRIDVLEQRLHLMSTKIDLDQQSTKAQFDSLFMDWLSSRYVIWILGILITVVGGWSAIWNYIWRKTVGRIDKQIQKLESDLAAQQKKVDGIPSEITRLSQQAENKLAAEVVRITSANERLIKDQIKSQKRIYQYQKEKKILILTQKEDDKTTPVTTVKRILKRFDNSEFKGLSEDDLITAQDDDYSDYDMVVIEDADASRPLDLQKFEKEIVGIANKACGQDTALIYFGSGNFPADKVEPKMQHLINFANKPATLFANMIQLFDFQALLEESS